MAYPLPALLSLVKNNVTNGLRMQANLTFSDDLVIADLLQARAGLLKQYSLKNIRIKASSLTQTMPVVPIQRGSLLETEAPGELPAVLAALGLRGQAEQVSYIELPNMITGLDGRYLLEYAGSLDGLTGLKVLYGNDYRYLAGERLTSRWPALWLNEDRGWLLRTPPAWVALQLRAALFDPRQVTAFSGRFTEETPVPMPDWLEEELVRNVTNKYISMYSRLNPRPNDGTSAT